MPKPIRSGLEFEASFPVKGRILRAVLCECEEEGYIRIRVARNPKKGWGYEPKDASTYVDIHGLDPRGSYMKVRAGEWAEGRVVCFGYLKKVRARRTEFVGSVLESGARLIGEVRVDDAVTIDFGLFEARLASEDEEERKRALRASGLRDGSFVATDVGVDVELKRWGSRDSILRRKSS